MSRTEGIRAVRVAPVAALERLPGLLAAIAVETFGRNSHGARRNGKLANEDGTRRQVVLPGV